MTTNSKTLPYRMRASHWIRYAGSVTSVSLNTPGRAVRPGGWVGGVGSVVVMGETLAA